ncbi:MAG TPA: class II aldolase/adducin family protein [Thermomicrobiales bacterium]
MDQTLEEQIAWACRILAMGGHGDFTLGHVSARAGDRVLMKRNGIGLEEVTPEDVLTLDFDARKIAGEGRVHLEAVLHTEVYKVRADVGAVIHTHPPYTTALAATGAKLELLNHDAVLFKDGLALFDETAELITEAKQGAAVARALGDKRAVLLRGHGVLVAGKSVPWAVYTALTLERAIQIQAIARALGELRPMSAEMAEQVYPAKYRDEYLDTYWDYLIHRVRRAGLDDDMPWSLPEDAYAQPIRHP